MVTLDLPFSTLTRIKTQTRHVVSESFAVVRIIVQRLVQGNGDRSISWRFCFNAPAALLRRSCGARAQESNQNAAHRLISWCVRVRGLARRVVVNRLLCGLSTYRRGRGRGWQQVEVRMAMYTAVLEQFPQRSAFCARSASSARSLRSSPQGDTYSGRGWHRAGHRIDIPRDGRWNISAIPA